MGQPRLSRRAIAMPFSPIRKLTPLADQARQKGIHVYHLNIGQPDIETPKEMIRAVAAYEEKVLSYGPSGGLLELRLAVADYYRRVGIDVHLDNVWITTGGSEAILFSMLAVCDPGDEILVFEPFYTNYNGLATMANVKLVPLTTKVENGFHLPTQRQIEAKISRRTRAILINTPNNPTGTVLTEQEMYILYKVCKKHALFLLSDEVYREFVYDGRVQTSALSLPEIQDRVIVLDSISKRFSACGARVGCLISRNRKVMDEIIKFGQARLCPPTLEQIGAIAAYQNYDRYISPVIVEYEKRRNCLFEGLKHINGVYGHKPEGAFYTVLRLPVKDADRFCGWLLSDFQHEKKTVMLAPANGFYSTPAKGTSEVRIAYVLKEDDLRSALTVLAAALKEFKG